MYAYVDGNPTGVVDPNGLNPVLGALAGAGLEVLIQTQIQGRSFSELNYWDIGVQAAAGAVFPGSLGTAFKALKQTNRARGYSRKADAARKAYDGKAARAFEKKARKQGSMRADDVAEWAAGQAATQPAKYLDDFFTAEGCGAVP